MSLDLTFDEEKLLYLAVGALIINWASADSLITDICETLFKLDPSPKQTESPRSLSNREIYLKARTKSDSRFAKYRDEIRQLIICWRSVVKCRDFLTHGFLVSLNRETYEVEWGKLDKPSVVTIITYSVTEIANTAKVATEITDRLFHLAQSLHGIWESERHN